MIIVEDIVDTGTTIVDLMRILQDRGASEIGLHTPQPDIYKKDIPWIMYIRSNDFIVGLDWTMTRSEEQQDIYVLDTNMKYYILFGLCGKRHQPLQWWKYNLPHFHR